MKLNFKFKFIILIQHILLYKNSIQFLPFSSVLIVLVIVFKLIFFYYTVDQFNNFILFGTLLLHLILSFKIKINSEINYFIPRQII